MILNHLMSARLSHIPVRQPIGGDETRHETSPLPRPVQFLNVPGKKGYKIGDKMSHIVHGTWTTTYLPEARGWLRPQCSHDSLCRRGQTFEHRSQCHHHLRLQSKNNATYVGHCSGTSLANGCPVNHSLVYTKYTTENMPRGNELEWFLKDGGGRIFKNYFTQYTQLTMQIFSPSDMNRGLLSCASLCNSRK